MKKILSALFALALVTTCLWVFSTQADAATVASGTCGNSLTWTLDDAGTFTVSGTGAMYNYAESKIPWKSYITSIKSVIIEPGVTTICSSAFRACGKLTSVNIADGVTSIGFDTFAYCQNLEEIHIPSTMTYIGVSAFLQCYDLNAVYIQDLAAWCALRFGGAMSNPLNYGGNLYLNGELVTDLVIPDGVLSIGEYAFSGFSDMKSVTIPASVTAVGTGAFSGCNNLEAVYIYDLAAWCALDFADVFTSPLFGAKLYVDGEPVVDLVIPDGVTYIGQYAFAGSGLNSVTIPSSVTTIGNNAFSANDGLLSVTVPANVTNMGKYIFEDCVNLTSANVESGAVSVGYAMFHNCENLTAVTIPASVTTIERFAFEGCTSLKDVYYGADSAKWNSIDLVGNEPLTGATIHYNHIHDYSLFQPVTVPATCAETGYVEYTCIYGDLYRMGLAKLPHSYTAGEMVIAPTCTQEGYIQATCVRCGYEETRETIKALGHSYTGAETVIKPTCMEEGYTNVSCIRCDSVERQNIIPTLGHKLVIAPAVAPTCTETGLTAGSHCERCQMVGVAQQVVPASGHSFAEGVCTVCGAPQGVPGDLDGVEGVNEDDVIYLLQHLLMPEDFAVNQIVDYDKNDVVDEDDVIYLLQHLLMPDDFPL